MKRISRLVIMPQSFPSASTIGTPEMRYLPISSSASATILSGERKNGFTITPFCERFTLSISSACLSIVMFLWMIPIPPSRETAIAIADSVTVSIAEVMIGMLSVIPLQRVVLSSTRLGVTSDSPGTSKTSSKVRPSFPNLASKFVSSILFLHVHYLIY